MFKDKERKKEYQKLYVREWYKRNKDKQIESNRVYKKKEKQKYHDYRSTLKCSKCGENHPSCLDFHHINPLEKEKTVHELIQNGYSFDRIKEEIDKCLVLCANCHRKEHWIQNDG